MFDSKVFTPALTRALDCFLLWCEWQAYKPEAAVRAYRAFVESFGGNFAPPPVRGAAKRIRLTSEDLAQQKRTQHLSDVRYRCRLCFPGRRGFGDRSLRRFRGSTGNRKDWFVSKLLFRCRLPWPPAAPQFVLLLSVIINSALMCLLPVVPVCPRPQLLVSHSIFPARFLATIFMIAAEI